MSDVVYYAFPLPWPLERKTAAPVSMLGGAVTCLAIALQGQVKKVYAISLAGSIAPGDVKWAERFKGLKGKLGAAALFSVTFYVPLVERLATWITTK